MTEEDDDMPMPPFLRGLLLGFAAGLLGGALLATVAWGHEAPAGWAYDPDCCSGRDCGPAAFNRVQAAPEGWHIVLRAGEHHHFPGAVDMIVPFEDRRVRPSPDTEYHICLGATGHLFCLYVPELGG